MTLTNPLALWLLLLLPVPLLLARRRTPSRRQAVSNLYLWRNLIRRDPTQLTFRRLHSNWRVALQMAFLAAVIVALARPSVSMPASRAAFVFDVSASMGARDGTGTRLDLARTRARAIRDSLPRGARVTLIASGPSARDLGEFAISDPALSRALDALTPTAGRANLPAGVSLATVTGITPGEVHVLSDGSRKEDGVAWERVGHAEDNLAIVTVAARRLPLQPFDAQVLVEVRNYGSQQHDVEVEIQQDGQPIARERAQIPARDRHTIVVRAAHVGRVIAARLVGDDALQVDDQRVTVLPPLERVSVGLSGRDNPFLEKALRAYPNVAVQDAGLDRAMADVLVCNACSGVPEARKGVLIIPPPAGSSDEAVLTIAKPDHQLATSLDPADTFVRPLPPQVTDEGGDVVLRAGSLPAVTAHERDGRRIVEMSLDAMQPDFALSTAFPILIANSVDWLAGRNENPLEVISGEPLRWMLPDAAVADVSVTGPDGQPRRVQLAAGRLTVADTDLPGVYRVRTAGAEQLFVANPSVETESDLISSGADTPSSTATTDAPRSVQPQRPLAPWLLLLGVGLFSVEWWFRRGRTIARLAIATCLILSATGLAIALSEQPITAVAVLDRSASIPLRAQERAVARVNAFAATMRPHDRLGVVTFGANAVVESRPEERMHLSALASTVTDTGTDIAAGLRLARAALPRDGARRIVLVSDGRETTGEAEREAAYAAADGIQIDTVPPDTQGVRRPPIVTRVVAPGEVRIDEPYSISVEIEGSSGARGQLTVYRDDQPFATSDITIAPTVGTTSATFSDRDQQPGTHVYRALVRDPADEFADQSADDAGSGAVVSISGEPTVLYVSSAPGVLRGVLSAAGFRVTEAAPGTVPTTSSRLAAYDGVVLDDVPSEQFNTSQMQALAQYVERIGGGLLLLGTSRSLNLAGYPTGPLGRLLPIDLRPRAGTRSPSLGLVLVFDKSGSMADVAGGTPKIELARQAAMRVLDVLPSTDSLGLIAFDSAPVAVAPLASGHDARAIAERLRAIAPGGSTSIAPAAELALQWLGGQSGGAAARRQILLVSDGRTSPDDAARLRAAMANASVQLSVVAIGQNADRDLLQSLAESTGGRAYFPDDVAELPLIVAREAVRSAGEPLVQEPVTLRAAPHPVLAGVDRALLPGLGGYVVSASKATATSILVSNLDDPILSAWRSGLGRVAVFTADLRSPTSSQLRAWSNYGRLWAQSMRWLSRRADDRSLQLALTDGGDGMRVSMDAERADGNFLNLGDARAIVALPSGDTQEVTLNPSAPGRYDATIALPTAGPYVISVGGVDADTGAEHRVVRGWYWSPERERRFQGPDLAFLTRLARTTGGQLLEPADGVFNGARPAGPTDISPWLILAALSMFLLDIAVRRGVDDKRLRHWLLTPRRFVHKRVEV